MRKKVTPKLDAALKIALAITGVNRPLQIRNQFKKLIKNIKK